MNQVFLNRWFLYFVVAVLVFASVLFAAKGYFFIALSFVAIIIFIIIWEW